MYGEGQNVYKSAGRASGMTFNGISQNKGNLMEYVRLGARLL